MNSTTLAVNAKGPLKQPDYDTMLMIARVYGNLFGIREGSEKLHGILTRLRQVGIELGQAAATPPAVDGVDEECRSGHEPKNLYPATQ